MAVVWEGILYGVCVCVCVCVCECVLNTLHNSFTNSGCTPKVQENHTNQLIFPEVADKRRRCGVHQGSQCVAQKTTWYTQQLLYSHDIKEMSGM